jgi:hypothetical protein
MADPGQVTAKNLSASTDGLPILVTGTTAGSPTEVHASPAGTETLDLVTLCAANTDETSTYTVGVVCYTASPTDPASIMLKIEIPPKSGAFVLLDGSQIGNGKKLGVYCATGSKITVHGRVARATL